MINEFNLQRVVFHGCQLGLVSVRNGQPIKKPWAFETTIPEIVSAFEPLKCKGDHVHQTCEGPDTNISGFYTWQMTDQMHKCFQERIHNLSVGNVDIAAVELIPLIDVVPANSIR